jgi:hypothetical protein
MMIAAETEMFKLSVKPTMGIFKKTIGTLQNFSSDNPSWFQKIKRWFRNIKIFHQTIVVVWRGSNNLITFYFKRIQTICNTIEVVICQPILAPMAISLSILFQTLFNYVQF